MPDEVIGRDDLIAQLWDDIPNHPMIMIDAARRLGKTTIMKHMAENPKSGVLALWTDLLDIDHTYDFYRRLYGRCKRSLPWLTRAFTGTKRFMGTLGGLSLGPLKLPEIKPFGWVALFESLVVGITESSESHVVLFLDEIPTMLHQIAHKQSANEAQSAFSLLRRLAQEIERLTIVFSGSLGLHVAGCEEARKSGFFRNGIKNTDGRTVSLGSGRDALPKTSF